MEERYEILVDDYYNRTLTDEELEYLINTLKERIRTGVELFAGEIDICRDAFYHEYGDILEEGRHGTLLRQLILKLGENEFYSITGWDWEYGSDYEGQTPKRVKLKPVQVMKWVEV